MEHDRIVVPEYRRIKDTRLTQRHPGLDTRVGNDTLSRNFGQTIMVIRRDANRISRTAPMKRFAAVAHLRHRTYIDHFRLFLFRLCQDRLGDILRRRDIRAQRCLRPIICLRRDHTAYVQYDIRTCDSL